MTNRSAYQQHYFNQAALQVSPASERHFSVVCVQVNALKGSRSPVASNCGYENEQLMFFQSDMDVKDVTFVSFGRLCVTSVAQFGAPIRSYRSAHDLAAGSTEDLLATFPKRSMNR